MTTNKEWMSLFNDRLNEKYQIGVETFLNFAFGMAGSNHTILCPCVKCINTEYKSREEVKLHQDLYGMMPNYTTWLYHGEKLDESSLDDEKIEESDGDIEGILKDLYPGLDGMDGCDSNELETNPSCQSKHSEEPNKEAKAFYRLLKESEQPSYPGCETSKLSILVHLLHIKSIGRWSNESFDMLLQLLKRILPAEVRPPPRSFSGDDVLAQVNDLEGIWLTKDAKMKVKLKQLIRNMARPEGSIAEGYIAKECMTLCSRYLKSIQTKFNMVGRTCDDTYDKSQGQISVFSQRGRALGAGLNHLLSDVEWEKAHIYILKNCDEIQPFLEEYSENHPNNVAQMWDDYWNNNFIPWFKNKVEKIPLQNPCNESYDLLSLSRGHTKYVKSFSGYTVNGFRFRIEDRDRRSRTQNSGVCVVGEINSDTDHINYYGVLTEILELQYLNNNRVVLFGCKWYDVFDNERGAKLDEYGFTTINCHRFLKTNEPFVLANQAVQVFYVMDNINKGWCVVVKTQPRDLYEILQPEENDSNDMPGLSEAYQHGESFSFKFISKVPEVREVSILGEYNSNERVVVKGDVMNGTEEASTVKFFITKDKHLSINTDLLAISECMTSKEFQVPKEAVGHYLVAKFTPKSDKEKSGKPKYVITDNHVKDSTSQEARKVRGKNKNKKVAMLNSGEKLEIEFYNNRAVGKNHTSWSRHLGKIGGKHGHPPDVSSIFKVTRQKKRKFVQPEAEKKYDEIVEIVKSNPSLPPIKVVEKSFGPQKHSNVFTFGGGMKRKHFKDSSAAYIEELEAKLRQKEEENMEFKRYLDSFESKFAQIEKDKQYRSESSPNIRDFVFEQTAGALGGIAASFIRVPTEGYGSFLLRDLPFDAIQFCIYEQLRIGYKLAAKRELNDPENAMIGSFAGALTGAITTPLDVIKTRLMIQGSANQYKGIFDCVQTIVRDEGPSALLKGIGPRVMWIGIGGSIFFGVLERMKHHISASVQHK
ncbi:S-adenosylmethionine carrier 1 [Perilla frutescens var. hirtella]|nr:S-adenosylmethionine carrier 1 [Perilla frutescens var. hirtella]